MSNNWVPPVPPTPTSAQPPQKKSKWWLYGLLGCGGLVLIVFIAFVALGAYIWQKAPKTEGQIVAKIIELANPDIEIVNLDETAGNVTVKDKKTGKTTTISLDDAKAGNITFTSEDTGEAVTFGSNAAEQMPSWVTPYPGATAQGGLTGMKQGVVTGGNITYSSTDPVSQVIAFYKERMTEQGFQLKEEAQMAASESFAMVSGSSADEKRTLTVSASSAEGQTTIQLAFEEKSE